MIYFSFILVPLSMAYFLMFLVAPLMNGIEFKAGLPHGVGVILTLIIFFSTLAAIAFLVYGELSVMLLDDAFVKNLEDFVDDCYSSLNDSGIKVLRPEKEGYTPDEIAGYLSV